MQKYIAALDQGTTSSRCIIFDRDLNIMAVSQKEFSQIFPKSGWVEQRPADLYVSQYSVLLEAMETSGIRAEQLAGIGITNQRETTILWDKETGNPVYNAIVWQCRRTSEICEELKARGLTDYIKDTTGLLIDAYFSGTKIKWILDHVPEAREKAKQGKLLFGTVDSWLIWKFTEGRIHVTDYTNASRTMLYNIKERKWDETILKELDIPACILPEVKSSSEIYGTMNLQGVDVPICGIAGDQQAALFGQACFEKGEAKNTYGTGCFTLMNIGDQPIMSKKGLVTTIAASVGDQIQYAVEGSVFVGGAVIQWLRDELRFIHESRDSEYFARKVADNGGVYVVPAFTGLGAPHWNMYARGTIFGLTRGSNRNHIIRASLESIAYQTKDVIDAMEEDTGIPIQSLKVDGGASANQLLMQFQSDILGKPLYRPMVSETTALGAAYLAGLAVGFWKDLNDVKHRWTLGNTYTPNMPAEQVQDYLTHWRKAVECTKLF
ncbi:MAG: glycerol kinase GlpK [Massiliimalia sp.]|jgi:glycerol kinase